MTQPLSNPHIAEVMNAVRRGHKERDANIVAAAFARDAVIFDLAPPLSHTFDADELQKWLQKWAGPVNQELHDFKLEVNGDLAFGHGLVHVTTQASSDETVAWWMRLTVCLKRQDDHWQITHEHTSVPFYMDGSNRAAIDLSP